jgi:hypothetical protein
MSRQTPSILALQDFSVPEQQNYNRSSQRYCKRGDLQSISHQRRSRRLQLKTLDFYFFSRSSYLAGNSDPIKKQL